MKVIEVMAKWFGQRTGPRLCKNGFLSILLQNKNHL